jgi:signal transduction histidine kinase
MEFTMSRDGQGKESKAKNILETLFSLPQRLTQPSAEITDEGTQRQARFLSLVLFVGVCVFPFLQFTSKVTDGYPYYSVYTVILAGLYLLSRTRHVQITSTFTIILSAFLPFLILSLHQSWSTATLAFQILPWPIFAALVGSQLLSIKKEALLIAVVTVGMILLSLVHPGIQMAESIELIAVSFAIQTMLGLTAWVDEYYRTKLESANQALAGRGRELEIYTSLLRHDLGNDIQMILGGIELAQMTENDNKTQKAFLESALAAAERMKNLIHVFSLSEEELDSDIVAVLEMIGRRATIAFKGMTVDVNASEAVRKNPPHFGRLTAIAFENLLRNSAQHAGENPKVNIELSKNESNLEVLFSDDGPGVDESIVNHLFERGITTGKKGRGLGLYLAKTIIESEKGNIQHISDFHQGCCFKIRLPLEKES